MIDRVVGAVLFDFDGTLVPCLDLPALKRDVLAHAVSHGVPRALLEPLYILEAVDAAAAWLGAEGAGDTVYHAAAQVLIRDAELAAAATTAPFPGVRVLLESLRARGVRVGIVTRNCEPAVRRMLPDVDALCDAFVPRERAAHLKPDPRHLLQCLAACGAAAGQTLMVGDGAMDMRVGRALDLYCVGVLTGVAGRALLLEAGAHLVLERVTDLRV